MARHPDRRLAPTREIDHMWHLHMLHPRAYQDDCQRVFGSVLGSSQIVGYMNVTSDSTPTGSYVNEPGGSSAIVVDNMAATGTYPEASSFYFTTQTKSTTTCGATNAYCAVKLTQSTLQ